MGIPAEKFLEMATSNGARALLWDTEIGSIERGKKADIIVIDLSKPHTTPINDPITTIIYAANSGDIKTTIIDGKILMRDKKFVHKDLEKILGRSIERASEIIEQIKESLNQNLY